MLQTILCPTLLLLFAVTAKAEKEKRLLPERAAKHAIEGAVGGDSHGVQPDQPQFGCDDLGQVYGYWELINEAIVQTWTEESNPFDEDSDWSETPGAYEDTGVLIYVDIPLQEEEGGEFVRYLIIIAAGNIDGEPKCWLYDDGGVGGRGPGVWHDICCWAQKRICYLINEILGFIGDIICPTSYCDACAAECEDANKACLPPPRGNPCHSCGFCGGMWLLCHIVPGGHC